MDYITCLNKTNKYDVYLQGAHLVLIGLPKQPIHIENPLPDVIFKSLTLKTVHGRRIWDTWENCEKLIAEKKVIENENKDLSKFNF